MSMRLVPFLAGASLLAAVLAIVPVVAISVAHGNLNGLAFGGVLALLAISCLTGAASWVIGLIAAAGRRRWDWFVAVLLLGVPAALAVGLMSHDARHAV